MTGTNAPLEPGVTQLKLRVWGWEADRQPLAVTRQEADVQLDVRVVCARSAGHTDKLVTDEAEGAVSRDMHAKTRY